VKLAVGAVPLALVAGAFIAATLPRPPFPGPVKKAPEAKRLVVVLSRKLPPGPGRATSTCRLANVPDGLRGLPLQRTFCPGGPAFAFYGRDGASARILLSVRLNEFLYALDFENYVWPPRIRPGEREFVYEELVWARDVGDVLYVENAHLTYAKSSYGQNAYMTAIDTKTRRRLWRSRALVANAATFAVTPHYLVTGYGFTDEPDYLYLLDRRTGHVVERLKLPSAPERITASGRRFLVRTYDHVLVVRLRA
jgi:hypothetical protein